MNTIHVRTGSSRLRVPLESGIAELDAETARHAPLIATLREREAEVERLAGEIAEAQRQALDAGAEALLEPGKRKTRAVDTAALETKLTEARDKVNEAARALVILEERIAKLVAEHAPAWRDELTGELDAALAEWRTQLEPLRALAERLALLVSRRQWASEIASNGLSRPREGALLLHGLVGKDGTPLTLPAVLEALQAVGEPAERPVRKTFDEQWTERQERITRLKERDAAFDEKAREVTATMPKPVL